MNISDVIEAVKAVRKFSEAINDSEVTKEDIAVLAKVAPSIKDGYANMAKWIEGGNENA